MIELKRTHSARLLLVVFVSMLLLASLHVHAAAACAEATCEECIGHVKHSGHIAEATASVDSCVLCQLISVPFVAAVVLAVAIYKKVVARLPLPFPCSVPGGSGTMISLRAPPSVV